MTINWQAIDVCISEALGERCRTRQHRPVGGGSINDAYVVSAEQRQYFIKLNRAERLEMFEAERAGLEELAGAAAIRVPRPVCCGAAGGVSFLVLEYLALGGGGAKAMADFGRQLAALHRVSGERFGWYRDNTIGSTPQHNSYTDNWLEFWREQRLGFQLELLRRQGHSGRLQQLGARLLAELPALFNDYQPRPALLHGDLWSGNYAIDTEGRPVIFDPAVYYGDRETDLAMTELFGGFSGEFYAAYRKAYPLDAGYATRKQLYNLYHVLNHANLFGGGYAAQAERMLGDLLGVIA